MHLFYGPQFAHKRFYPRLVWAPKSTSLNPTEADLGAVVTPRGIVPSLLTPTGTCEFIQFSGTDTHYKEGY